MMLADVLRSASDEQLAALLMARRDLATPPPADTEVLARRAATAGSVARACEQLNARQLAVAEALLLLGADTEPVAKTAVDDLLGVDAADDLAALERLVRRAGNQWRCMIRTACCRFFFFFPKPLPFTKYRACPFSIK